MKLHKSKLIQLLGTLTNKELKWFEYYIYSPFFNKNENVLKLFEKLKTFHPEYNEEKITLEEIFPAVFPDESAEEQKLRYVMTDLTKLLEDYLAYVEYEKNDVYKKHLLLKAFDNRYLDKHFLSTLDEAYSQQKRQPFRDVNYFFNQHLLEESAYLHSLSREPRSISNSLQEAVDNLDYYYLSNRLRYSMAILNRQSILQEKYNNSFLNEILAFLDKINLTDTPSVSIYHAIVLMHREPENEEHYQRVKSLLGLHWNKFPMEESKDMYMSILNYATRKLNAGKLHFLDEMFELYKQLIEKEIIFEGGYLLPITFKNIVTISLRLSRLEWAEDFIEKYKERVMPEYKDSTYHYNLANLYYYKKEFSKALKTLQIVDMEDIYYHLDGKALLLKTYYELDESEPFFSLVDAFINYLKRNKLISESQRTGYLNLVKYARKLMQIRLGSRHTPAGVREELSKLSNVGNLQWLHEKLDELEGAHTVR